MIFIVEPRLAEGSDVVIISTGGRRRDMVVGTSDHIVQNKGDVREECGVRYISTIGEDHIDPDGRP